MILANITHHLVHPFTYSVTINDQIKTVSIFDYQGKMRKFAVYGATLMSGILHLYWTSTALTAAAMAALTFYGLTAAFKLQKVSFTPSTTQEAVIDPFPPAHDEQIQDELDEEARLKKIAYEKRIKEENKWNRVVEHARLGHLAKLKLYSKNCKQFMRHRPTPLI